MLIAASRCYLIQMLRSVLTCTNDCSCWSADEENSSRVFPYHGCALPTKLGGQVTVLRVRHRHCSRDADEATDKSGTHRHIAPTMLLDHCGINPANALLTSYPAPSTAHASGASHRRASRPDRAATPALRLGTRWHQPAGVNPERKPHSLSHSRLTRTLTSTQFGWCSRRCARSPGPVTHSFLAPVGSRLRPRRDHLADRPARGGDDHARALQRRDRARGLPRRGRRRRGRGPPAVIHDRRRSRCCGRLPGWLASA
jgi:hypothetical protein